jgi:hypothetical protein
LEAGDVKYNIAKKEPKKLRLFWDMGEMRPTPICRNIKVFLLLFIHKESFLDALASHRAAAAIA